MDTYKHMSVYTRDEFTIMFIFYYYYMSFYTGVHLHL